MELMQMIEHRRSIRQYTGEHISEENLEKILKAGLLAPSGRNIRPFEFVVVRDREMLNRLSTCRPAGPGMLKNADAAIVVLADTSKQDVWVEDASIAMTLMHLMADSLGVGSCWIQGRLRQNPEGGTADEYVRNLLGYPENYSLEAILSLGMPAQHPEPKLAYDVSMDKVHFEKF